MSWLGRTPWMLARSRMRSAPWAGETAASAANTPASKAMSQPLGRNFIWASEGKDGQEKARQPAHGLRLVDGALAAVVDARVGDLGGIDGVAGDDLRRVDHPG